MRALTQKLKPVFKFQSSMKAESRLTEKYTDHCQGEVFGVLRGDGNTAWSKEYDFYLKVHYIPLYTKYNYNFNYKTLTLLLTVS